MKVLVIGGGGREHALAWKIGQSDRVTKVYVAPGNAGTSAESRIENIVLTGRDQLIEFAKRESIALTVVGPEAPLAAGIVDAFRAAGLKIFGPTQHAARLESSKDFAKAFMLRHGIPTAPHQTFDDAQAAHAYVDKHALPLVVKADGLAGGKGVVVAQRLAQAHAAIDSMLGHHGLTGRRVVIEDFMPGEEASFIVLADGKHALSLATSQDHKRLLDGDRGPNTGGMGAYSPAPVITPSLHAKVMREIIQPVLVGMAKEGTPYTGFLYAGLMIGNSGEITVLEFNCRLGDPEAQPILLRLKSDLVVLLEYALNAKLDQTEALWDTRAALGVVVAAHGYPEAPRTGDVIESLSAKMAADDYHVFHGSTAPLNSQIVTSGGRVLCVTALGVTLPAAQRRAYEITEKIHFDGMQYRTDIGHRALTAGKFAAVRGPSRGKKQ
jgi:phosphoribosylamine--glycine ligase